MQIPRAALTLGLAGLSPFAYGAATAHAPGLAITPMAGVALLNLYGVVILCFMAGVLWGYAAKGDALAPYALSVLPAIFVLIAGALNPGAFAGEGGLILLLISFFGLLALDYWFSVKGLTPGWWMRLRMLLTSGVALCLVLGAAA